VHYKAVWVQDQSLAIKILIYSDSFEDILLAVTYVSIGILSYYNSKLLRDYSKIKEFGSVQLRAL